MFEIWCVRWCLPRSRKSRKQRTNWGGPLLAFLGVPLPWAWRRTCKYRLPKGTKTERRQILELGHQQSAPQTKGESCHRIDIRSQERIVDKKSRGRVWALERAGKGQGTVQSCREASGYLLAQIKTLESRSCSPTCSFFLRDGVG